MDVISNTIANRKTFDDLKNNIGLVSISETANDPNQNTKSSTLFIDDNKNKRLFLVGDTNNIDAITQDIKLVNKDKSDLYHEESNNFTHNPKLIKSVDKEKKVVNTTLDTFSIYGSTGNFNILNDNKSTNKPDMSAAAYTINKEESNFQDISPNETSNTFTEALLYPCLKEYSTKSPPIFCPFTSNTFGETEVTVVESTINNKKSFQQSEFINQAITSKNNVEEQLFCNNNDNNDTENFQPNTCILISEKFSEIYSGESFIVDDNTINTACKNKMIDENTSINNTFKNSNVVDLKDKQCLKNQNYNNTLPIFINYSIENGTKKINSTSLDTNSTISIVQKKIKNQVYSNPITPTVAISNSIFFDNNTDDGVTSSNIDRKKMIKSYPLKSNSSEKRNNNIFDMMSAENLRDNISNLNEVCHVLTSTNSSYSSTICNNLKINKDLKYLIKKTKTNDIQQFSKSNYVANSYVHNIQLSPQSRLEDEKYKNHNQEVLQNIVEDKNNQYISDNNSYKISYTNRKKNESKTAADSSLGSLNNDNFQRKNTCEYNKITQSSKSMANNNLVHDTNGYNSNITVLYDNIPKFTNHLDDGHIDLTKQYQQYRSSAPATEPLLSLANKLPSYVDSHVHTKHFTKKYLHSIPSSKTKTLTQLKMSAPDFNKIPLIECTQKENESLQNTNKEYSVTPQKKKCTPVNPQNFEEISKKFNYIKDLQLKNTISSDQSRCKGSLNNNYEPQRHNSYSNLYVKAPDFSKENFNKCEKINNTNYISNLNSNSMSKLSNDLPTIEPPNTMNTGNYRKISNDKSTITHNVEIKSELYNNSNISSNIPETKVKPVDECYHKKSRIPDKCNRNYYTSYPFHRDENHTAATYQVYNQDINSLTNVRNNILPNAYLKKDEFSQNCFQESNNYKRNCNENTNYNIKRTTSVIQSSGKHIELDFTSNFMNSSSSEPVQINWNNRQELVKSPQQEISNCLCRNLPTSFDSNEPFSTSTRFINVATSPTNVQSCINIAYSSQNKNEEAFRQSSLHHEIVQNVIKNTSAQNSTLSQKNLPLTKSIMKQLNNTCPQLLLDISQKPNTNSYDRNSSQSYYNAAAARDDSNTEKNTLESVTYKRSINKSIEYNNLTHLHTVKTKHIKGTEYNNINAHPAFKYSTISSASKSATTDTSRLLQKPNYRKMINHVYAMRNSTSEDDLNLQIIKRTLNYDISLRKSENDLSQNIFDTPASKTNSNNSTYFSGNISSYYPSCDEKTNNTKNQYNIGNIPKGYTDSFGGYHQEEIYNIPLADNDISVTLSNVTKSNKITSPFPVVEINNTNINSDYPKAFTTKVRSRKTDNKSFPVDIDCTVSRYQQMTSTETTTKTNITVPLDLSVKTVKTIADSTGCGDDNVYNRIRNVEVEGNRYAPKFVFQPNFSNSHENSNEKNTILHSVTSSIKQKNSNNNTLCTQLEPNAVEDKSYCNKIDELNFLPPLSQNVTSKITPHYGKDPQIVNKIKSNISLFPPLDINLRIDQSTIYPEYHKEQIPWQQQSTYTENVNTINNKNILLPTPHISAKFEHSFQKLLKICNNTTSEVYATNRGRTLHQNFDIGENIYNTYAHRFSQKTKDINCMKIKNHQIDNKIRNQNKTVRNNKKRIEFLVSKTETVPQTVEFGGKVDVGYSIRKRRSDIITKQLPPKKIRVDDIYAAHLEETSKQQTIESINNNFIRDHIVRDNPGHLEQNCRNNEQILYDAYSNPELSYSRSQKLQKKIWYPPIPETKYQEKYILHGHEPNILPEQKVAGSSISLSSNLTIPSADQNVISKLKNSIEMRENEKLKLAKLPENNEESSKYDIVSLLAARIRTKGELKGFHPSVILENKQNKYVSSDVVNTKQLSSGKIDDFSSEQETKSALNLLDWRSACNDFVEQLKCTGKQKQTKKLRSTKICNGKQLETIKSFSAMEYQSNIKNCLEDHPIKSAITSCIAQSTKNLPIDSSDEDKPLLLLRQRNYSQTNNVLLNITGSDKIYQTSSLCKDSILQICQGLDEVLVNKSTHNSIVERLSEKIARNIREKQRIEQEKRLVARLGKTSSSESEHNIRTHRQKKITNIKKSRNNNGVSNRELTDSDSSRAESFSMNINLIRNREVSKKRKYINLENDDLKRNLSKICTIKTEESQIDFKGISEKQVMTKAEMKFMVPPIEIIHKNTSEHNDDHKNEDEVQSFKKQNICEINPSKGFAQINKSKTKKISLTTAFDNQNPEIQLEETMTRSKRKKALENQIANSKILRNDKIIKYIYNDRTKKTNDKKQERNIRKSKTSRLKSESDIKTITHANDILVDSSASSIDFDIETVSDRLRPRRLFTDNRNCKRSANKFTKLIKENVYNNKKKNKLMTNHTKGNIFKKKNDQEGAQNTATFPPGWQDQVYEYKKSLKVPLRLITIKGPHNHRISTSLPDLDSHSCDDTTENCSVESKKKLYENVKKHILEPPFNSGKSKKILIQTFSEKDNYNCIEEVIQRKDSSPPKSIIDVLHSRVIRSNKEFVKKNFKSFNNYEPKLLPRAKNELELLPTLTINKTSEPLNEHHNVFKTEVLQSRTRTETRNLKNKELIREVFGGEDRPASAPPQIRKADNKVIGTISFEEKYEQYLQKINIDFGEKIRENNNLVLNQSSNVVKNNEDLNLRIKNERIDDDYSKFMPNESDEENIKERKKKTEIIKADKTLNIISNPDGVGGIIPKLFKHKKSNKYRNGRRKGSSGFDYIRKKKKPSSAITSLSNQENLKKKKFSPVEFHHARDENDVCKEIQKWVLNKSVGQSALHKAARLGYLDVIVYCLERLGINPDPKDNAGYTPLHEACSKGRIDIARVLLQYGANHSETAHSGIRPLHEASENGYIEIVRLLLSYGADPLLTTYSGQTPLMLSESNEMEQFIKNHLYDVQNTGPYKQPWKFPGPWKIFDPFEYGYDILSGAPDYEEFCKNNYKSFDKKKKLLAVDINKNKFILHSYNLDAKMKINSSLALGKELIHGAPICKVVGYVPGLI